MNSQVQNEEDLGLSFSQGDVSPDEPDVKIALERIDAVSEDALPLITKNIHDAPWGGYKTVDLSEQRVAVPSASIPANLAEEDELETSEDDLEQSTIDSIPTSSTIYNRTAQHKIENDALLDCDSVGHMLYTARVMLGLSYAEVEIGTKIRACFVEALEKNDFKKLPAKVYTIAYIRALCALYRIDKVGQELMIERLKELDGFNESNDGLLESSTMDKKSSVGKPSLIKSSEKERKNNIKGLIIVFALTLLVCAGILGAVYFIFYLIKVDNSTQDLATQGIRNEKLTFVDSDFSSMYITTPIIKMNEISQE